jgi:hypothetical protein
MSCRLGNSIRLRSQTGLQHKPWFDGECLGFLDQRKEAKIQWLQDPNQSTVDNLNNVQYEAKLADILGGGKKKKKKAGISES